MNGYLSLNTLGETLQLAFGNVVLALMNFIPQLIASLLVLFVGIVAGRWIKSLVKSILHAVQLSKLIKNTPFERFLSRAEIQLKVEEFIGEAVRLLILYIFLIAALNMIGLGTVALFLTTILSYIPRVLSASLIFAAGVLVAGVVEGIVKSAVGSIDLPTGRMVGKIAAYTVVIFGGLVAIGELGIAKEFINILFIGFVAMLALSFGLAFGLGAKDVVKKMVEDWYTGVKKK